MTTARIQILSTLADGSDGDRWCIDTMGIVGDVTFGTTFPGGDTTFTATLTAPVTFRHRALGVGRRIRLTLCGQTVWAGRLDSAEPGQPWQLSGTGIASMAADFAAIVSAGTNCYWLTDIIDQAALRGLPFHRQWGGSDPQVGYGQTTPVGQNASVKVLDALNTVGSSLNLNWIVYPLPTSATSAVVDVIPDPTTPTYVLYAQNLPGRTIDGFFTALIPLYIDSSTGNLTQLYQSQSAWSSLRGVREEIADLTNFNPNPAISPTGNQMTAAQATNYATTLLSRVGARAAVTGTFAVQQGQLLTYPGGTPVDNATVRAGAMVRILNLDPGDSYADVPIGAVDLIVGETQYDAQNEVLELIPRQFSARDINTLLTQLTDQ